MNARDRVVGVVGEVIVDSKRLAPVIELCNVCMNEGNEDDLFGMFDRLSWGIDGLNPEERKLFCAEFPYEKFVMFASNRDDTVGKMAFYCVSLCLDWEGLDFSRFQSDWFLEFLMGKLGESSDECDWAVHFLVHICALGDPVIGYLIERGFLEMLEGMEMSTDVSSIISRMCSCAHPRLERCVRCLSFVFASGEASCVQIGLIGWMNAVENDESVLQVASCLLLEMTPLFVVHDSDAVVKQFLVNLLYIESLSVEYFPVITRVMVDRYASTPKLLGVGCQLLVKHRDEWTGDAFELCVFLANTALDQPYSVRSDCVRALLAYYNYETHLLNSVVLIITETLVDNSLACFCAVALHALLEAAASKGHDISVFMSASIVDSLRELLVSNDDDVVEAASVCMKLIGPE